MKKSEESPQIPQFIEHPPPNVGLIKSSGEDRHGIFRWGRIRKLTPWECLRLQG